MPSTENRVVALSALVTLVGLGALGLLTGAVEPPGEWGLVAGLVLFLGTGYVLPQVYLMRTDDSVSHTARLGVITLMALYLAIAVMNRVSGVQQVVAWGVVAVSVVGILLYEAVRGYRQSMESEGMGESL